jgi:hypothetical protein
MDWNEAIAEWQKHIDQKYTKEIEYTDYEGNQRTRTAIEYPEQDITIEYNAKPLIHVNGDYKPNCIKNAMAKTFVGKGKNRVEQEIENAQ